MLREPKRHFTEWEKISDHMSNKGLIFEICKAFSIQKIQQEPIPETPVKILKMTRRNMKICSSWLMIMISTHKKIQRFVKKKNKNRNTMWSSNFTPRHLFQELKSTTLKNISMGQWDNSGVMTHLIF